MSHRKLSWTILVALGLCGAVVSHGYWTEGSEPNPKLIQPSTNEAPHVVYENVEAGKDKKTVRKNDAPEGMREGVWDMAKAVRKCAIKSGEISSNANMAIIDYDMPSSEKRLWIIDPSSNHTLMTDWVAHGSGSGELMASRFSNTEGSFQSSLGVFRFGEVYRGQHGASLRLDGLEEGFNDQARPRAIVMHAAWYVSPSIIKDKGRLGRSQGCPAVRSSVLDVAQKELAGGGLLFSYSSRSKWTQKSNYLQC